MTGNQALQAAIPRLVAAGIPDAPRDARLLLAHAMALAPDRLTLHLSDTLSAEAVALFETAVTARSQHQPVSQIIGHRLFWGRSFRVTRDTLDPRPETEVLIIQALSEPFSRILDLGTGTGAILLTLLAEGPQATGVGTDISPAALAVARDNALAMAVADRATFLVSDWFSAVDERFDLILSNPPYIAQEEMANLSPDVRDWEPHLALTPGGDGLDPYRKITAGSVSHLRPSGRLIVEIGPTQGQAVAGMMAQAGLVDVRILPDMDGRDRIVAARRA
jgi:release factor glutamine methyltransferase